MSAVALLLLLAAVPPALACAYLLALTLLSRRTAPPTAEPRELRRFLVVVPAHDEAAGIAGTLRNLQSLDYPVGHRELVVVADNCSDATAAVARAHGATVLERHDPARRGKGYALEYAFTRLLAAPRETWDALVVVDADTTVSPNLLRAFNARLAAGESAVQAAYLPQGGSGGRLAVITEVALTAFHLVRSSARERLRLSAGLRGNGMAFSRDVLARVPHDAFSRTEDLEFGIRLGLAGVRVAFAAEATVRGEMPEHTAVVETQRQRWIGGRVEIARRFVPGLLAATLRRRSLMLADLAADLLVPPLSLLLLFVLAGTTAAAAAAVWSPAALPALGLWLAASLALGTHVLHAAHLAGRLAELGRAATAVPAYAFGKTMIALRALRPRSGEWVRTARKGEVR